jgi:transcriptional regulator with XRE-family HTH domain
MARPVTLHDAIAALPKAEQEAIAERAAELIAEVRSLMDLRKAKKLTQAELARRLDISQESVSRLEKRSDMLISTLTKHVEKLGGELVLVARFPGAAPVRVRLGEEVATGSARERSRTARKSTPRKKPRSAARLKKVSA